MAAERINTTNQTATNQTSLNFTEITNAINSYVVSPLANLGIGGFVFTQARETSVSLQSEITNHFVENNSTIQNNIGLKPVTLQLSGYIAEKSFKKTTETQLQKGVKIVTTVASFAPLLTQGARQAKQIWQSGKANKNGVLDFLKGNVNNGVDIFNTFRTLLIPLTEQAKAYNYFYALWQAKQLVALETPYRFFSKMAILNVSMVQGEKSKSISEVSITLQEIRTAEVLTTDLDKDKYKSETKSYPSASEANKTNNGIVKGIKKNISVLKDGINKLLGR